jgi:hypothetical protein
MAKRTSRKVELDAVDEAGHQAVPARDPPAGPPPGGAAPAQRLHDDPAARDLWNAAVEQAARVVEQAPEDQARERLCADIRSMKSTD